MKEILALPDAAATQAFGISLGQRLPVGTVLLLEGDLGSGKTTLVQGIGQGLGISEPIDSPTFTLINEYLSGRIPLYHLDLYRLEPSEVDSLCPEMYWEGIETPPGLVAIEWATRLLFRPDQYLQITLAHQPDGSRQAELGAIGEVDLPAILSIDGAPFNRPL
ncbi:MAG: tRNA (adenosine(37)-N6)-threonylcarbamoyltransferase complex ATPase subunit type 1 TsaE [Leptolyngbyaceae cyanobacterium bins.59]|nr:tRNA (adenosine(37)-N6)-threonylcarbamoyltransferase complex ATPase subunit type 1 TsaE [Leptolyngbyaceae cyanobacterium bins.59]